MKKILHVGNVANVGYILSREQRKTGHKSDVLEYVEVPYYYDPDLLLRMSTKHYSKFYNIISFFRNFINKNFFRMFRYDIYHVHRGVFILPNRWDIPLLKKFEKKVLLHFHGDDIRIHRRNNHGAFRNIRMICSTPDLLDYESYQGQITWMPNPVNFSKLSKMKKIYHESPVIVHAPTDRSIKGTSLIIKTIKNLKKSGYKFNFILNENLGHERSIANYLKSDICIDWINPDIGIYGMVSIENMALGNVCVCTLREDLRKKYWKGCPIIDTTPRTLEKDLEYIIESYQFRKNMIKKNKMYVKKMHDVVAINKKIEKIYKEC